MKLTMRWMTNLLLFVTELGKRCSCMVRHEFRRGANTESAKDWSRQLVGAVLTVVRQVFELKDPLRFREHGGAVHQFADEWAPGGLEVCFVDIDRSEIAFWGSRTC